MLDMIPKRLSGLLAAIACLMPATLPAQEASRVSRENLQLRERIDRLESVVERLESHDQTAGKVFIQRPWMNFPQVFGGASLIILGNALDLSGYATLFRSFSVLPEARELKTTGLYRFVRHPVYLGQFISQAGVWLIFAPAHWVWWSFYVTFIVLQLWRTKREDAVLERAFGNDFREWKERTFWFV